jgi:hypothetical protein
MYLNACCCCSVSQTPTRQIHRKLTTWTRTTLLQYVDPLPSKILIHLSIFKGPHFTASPHRPSCLCSPSIKSGYQPVDKHRKSIRRIHKIPAYNLGLLAYFSLDLVRRLCTQKARRSACSSNYEYVVISN